MTAEVLVETHALVKEYGDFVAVDGVDLRLSEGEVYGFLGPNGSGKSTTILMMLGLTEPTEGMVRVCGHDPTRDPIAVKRQVGYLPENLGFYGDLTGRENLRYTGELNNLDRAEAAARISELLDTVELTAAADQPVDVHEHAPQRAHAHEAEQQHETPPPKVVGHLFPEDRAHR